MFKPKFQIITEDIDNSSFFWRYIDIHEFLAFTKNKSLGFTRLDTFEDPLEAASIEELQTFYLPYVSSKDLKDENFNKVIPSEDIERIRAYRDHPLEHMPTSLHKRQKSRFASCWYYNKQESFAMWHLYSNPGSIAIKFKHSSLIESIEHYSVIKNSSISNGKIMAGIVMYEDYLQTEFYSKERYWTDEFLSHVKHNSFSHEKEYRFLFFPSHQIDTPRIELFFENFATLEFEIIAHPKMPDWKRKNLESYCNELNIKFKRSSLLVKM